jgi:hypothetical protein
MKAAMPAGDLDSFFWILCCNGPFSLGFDPEEFEDMEIHIHNKMPCCDNRTFD